MVEGLPGRRWVVALIFAASVRVRVLDANADAANNYVPVVVGVPAACETYW